MTAATRTVGVMGGFGPLAGAHFYRRLIELTDAPSDAHHLPLLLLSDPAVPSRLQHLAGEGPSPLPKLLQMAQRLVLAGAGLIAIPSATVHAYHAQIASHVDVEVLHLPRAALAAVRSSGARSVALLATTPTVRLGLYRAPAEEAGVEILEPDATSQQELMEVIADIKGEIRPGLAAERLRDIADRPWAGGADTLLLGCTELPAIFAHDLRPERTADATDELAKAVIRAAGGRVREG